MNETEPNDSLTGVPDVSEEATATEPQSPSTSRWRPIVFKVAGIMLTIVVVVGGLVWYAYQSTQEMPDFYRSALIAPPDLLDHEGQEFESRIFALQHESHEPGPWQAVFTEGQVNGWLATDLPEKFPDAIPREIAHPRIRISDDELELAFRCQSQRFNGIIVAKGDAFCTEHPNEIAFQIKSAKAGIIPLPIGPWVEAIARSLRQAGAETTWTEIDGDPTAIVALPRSLTDNDDLRFKLDTVQLTKGQLLLGGVTDEADSSTVIKVDEK